MTSEALRQGFRLTQGTCEQDTGSAPREAALDPKGKTGLETPSKGSLWVRRMWEAGKLWSAGDPAGNSWLAVMRGWGGLAALAACWGPRCGCISSLTSGAITQGTHSAQSVPQGPRTRQEGLRPTPPPPQTLASKERCQSGQRAGEPLPVPPWTVNNNNGNNSNDGAVTRVWCILGVVAQALTSPCFL